MTRKPCWKQEDPRFREESARYAKPLPSCEIMLAKLAEAQKPLGFDALATMHGIQNSWRVSARYRDAGVSAACGAGVDIA